MVKQSLVRKAFSIDGLFYWLLVFNFSLIFFVRFYPSMDGPAHLYNANTLLQILKGNSFLSDFYSINGMLIPNWTSHILMTFYIFLFPAWLAEKMFLITYVLGMAFSFRYMVKQLNPNNLHFSVLIFPFIFSFLFHLGFYNYSISFILLFLGLGYWSNTYHRNSVVDYLLISLLLSVAFFTNVLLFCFLGLTLGSHILWLSFLRLREAGCCKGENLLFAAKKLAFLLFSSLPGLLMLFLFSSNVKFFGNSEGLGFSELVEWIVNLRPLIVYNYQADRKFTIVFFVVLLLLATLSFLKLKPFQKVVNQRNNFLLIPLGITLLLFFIVPDSSSAGMMSYRYCYVLFVFFVIWVAVRANLHNVSTILILVFVLIHVAFQMKNFNGAIKGLNRDAIKVEDVGSYIESNSVVLPIDISDKWLEHHFSNYLGINKPMVILENYEASVGWFPLVWNNKVRPELYMGDRNSIEGVDLLNYEHGSTKRQIDYVFVYGNIDQFQDAKWNDLRSVLDVYYELVLDRSAQNILLYAKKIKS